MSDLTFWVDGQGDILVFHRFRSKANSGFCGAYVVGKANANGVVTELDLNGMLTASMAWQLYDDGQDVAMKAALSESLKKNERLRPPK